MYKNNFTFSIPGAKDNILAGTKVLTIRKLPAKVGKELVLRTGSRWIKSGTPGCLELIFPKGEGPICTGSWPIEIYQTHLIETAIDTMFFLDVLGWSTPQSHDDYSPGFPSDDCDHEKLNKFAKMGGWNNSKEMFDFFKNTYGLPFDGYINYWG